MTAGARFPSRRLFLQSEQWFHRAQASLPGALPCRKGCSRCCIGPFAITVLDADELRHGLATLPEPVRRDIAERAQAQTVELAAAFPQLNNTPFLDDWPDAERDKLAEKFSDRPCPALDGEGACRIYPFRPLACRTMGIPVESSGLVEGACEIQTAVPLIRLSRALREQEQGLAGAEADAIELYRQARPGIGEELLLAWGFLTGENRPPAR
jgi:Fe-S-cluster containining protein